MTLAIFKPDWRVPVGLPCPIPRGLSLSQGIGVTAAPKFLGPPVSAHTVWETTTKCYMVITLNVKKIFTAYHKCWHAICLP